MSVVTRCATSQDLTKSKHDRLAAIAERCGNVRRETWVRYGRLGGLGRTHRDIRDEDWMSSEFASFLSSYLSFITRFYDLWMGKSLSIGICRGIWKFSGCSSAW